MRHRLQNTTVSAWVYGLMCRVPKLTKTEISLELLRLLQALQSPLAREQDACISMAPARQPVMLRWGMALRVVLWVARHRQRRKKRRIAHRWHQVVTALRFLQRLHRRRAQRHRTRLQALAAAFRFGRGVRQQDVCMRSWRSLAFACRRRKLRGLRLWRQHARKQARAAAWGRWTRALRRVKCRTLACRRRAVRARCRTRWQHVVRRLGHHPVSILEYLRRCLWRRSLLWGINSVMAMSAAGWIFGYLQESLVQRCPQSLNYKLRQKISQLELVRGTTAPSRDHLGQEEELELQKGRAKLTNHFALWLAFLGFFYSCDPNITNAEAHACFRGLVRQVVTSVTGSFTTTLRERLIVGFVGQRVKTHQAQDLVLAYLGNTDLTQPLPTEKTSIKDSALPFDHVLAHESSVFRGLFYVAISLLLEWIVGEDVLFHTQKYVPPNLYRTFMRGMFAAGVCDQAGWARVWAHNHRLPVKLARHIFSHRDANPKYVRNILSSSKSNVCRGTFRQHMPAYVRHRVTFILPFRQCDFCLFGSKEFPPYVSATGVTGRIRDHYPRAKTFVSPLAIQE